MSQLIRTHGESVPSPRNRMDSIPPNGRHQRVARKPVAVSKGTNGHHATEPSVSKKRVIIVDDHTLMREGLRQLVNSEHDMTCIGTAPNAAEALAMVETLKPDMLTVDISLPGRNGLELIKDVLSIAPSLVILVISMHDEVFYTQRVLKAGAKGYVAKDCDRDTLLQAFRQVLNGGIYVSPAMSAQILETFSGRASGAAVDGVQSLSDREFEVFQLISDGQSTEQIGNMLHISVKTVHQHLSRIKDKLKLTDGVTVLRYAVRWAERLKFGNATAAAER
jgi:DNA-binding NarL/FixJ family response regulator